MATRHDTLVTVLRDHIEQRMQATSHMAAHTVDSGQRAYATGALRELCLLKDLLSEAQHMAPE